MRILKNLEKNFWKKQLHVKKVFAVEQCLVMVTYSEQHLFHDMLARLDLAKLQVCRREIQEGQAEGFDGLYAESTSSAGHESALHFGWEPIHEAPKELYAKDLEKADGFRMGTAFFYEFDD